MGTPLGRRVPVSLVAALLLTSVMSGCAAGGGDAQDGAAGETSLSFSEAISADDGAAACALLAEHTRSTLEADSGSPCDEAIVALGLPTSAGLDTVSAFGRGAQAVLDADVYFLVLEPAGWRVTAAGCQARTPLPYDCDVKGE